jgi:hypothetical protein
MAQKIAPAALRLYTNKKFDASWFSDRMYGSLLQQTLNIKKFVHSIFESIGTKTALSHVQATPQHIYIQSFFLFTASNEPTTPKKICFTGIKYAIFTPF